MKFDIEAGGEKYAKWALVQLQRLAALRADLRLPSMHKFWAPESGVTVLIHSSEWGDLIRITASSGGLFARVGPSAYAIFGWDGKLQKAVDSTGLAWDGYLVLDGVGGTVLMYTGNAPGGSYAALTVGSSGASLSAGPVSYLSVNPYEFGIPFPTVRRSIAGKNFVHDWATAAPGDGSPMAQGTLDLSLSHTFRGSISSAAEFADFGTTFKMSAADDAAKIVYASQTQLKTVDLASGTYTGVIGFSSGLGSTPGFGAPTQLVRALSGTSLEVVGYDGVTVGVINPTPGNILLLALDSTHLAVICDDGAQITGTLYTLPNVDPVTGTFAAAADIGANIRAWPGYDYTTFRTYLAMGIATTNPK